MAVGSFICVWLRKCQTHDYKEAIRKGFLTTTDIPADCDEATVRNVMES